MGAFTPMVPSKITGTRPGSPEHSGVPALKASHVLACSHDGLERQWIYLTILLYGCEVRSISNEYINRKIFLKKSFEICLTIFLCGFRYVWQFYRMAMRLWICWQKSWQFYCMDFWQFYCMDVWQFYHMDVWQFSCGCNLTIFLSPT